MQVCSRRGHPLVRRQGVGEVLVTSRTAPGTGWTTVSAVIRRKLDMLHYAVRLSDLESPPGNRLEPLKGKLAGLYSIRVNDQWRVVLRGLGKVRLRCA